MENCGHHRAWYPVIILNEESSDSFSSAPEMSNANNDSCADNLPGCPSASHEPCGKRTSRSKSRSRSRSHHHISKKREDSQMCRRRHSRSRSRARSRSRSRGRRMEKKNHHRHCRDENRCHLFLPGHHHLLRDAHHGHHGRNLYHFMKKSKVHHHHHHHHHGSRPKPHFLRHEPRHHCQAFRGPMSHAGPSHDFLIRTLANVLERVHTF